MKDRIIAASRACWRRWTAAPARPDVLDLAMMDLPPRRLRPPLEKAIGAYGASVAVEMMRAIDAFRERPGWLLRCTQALSVNQPAGLVQQRLRLLRRRLKAVATTDK